MTLVSWLELPGPSVGRQASQCVDGSKVQASHAGQPCRRLCARALRQCRCMRRLTATRGCSHHKRPQRVHHRGAEVCVARIAFCRCQKSPRDYGPRRNQLLRQRPRRTCRQQSRVRTPMRCRWSRFLGRGGNRVKCIVSVAALVCVLRTTVGPSGGCR